MRKIQHSIHVALLVLSFLIFNNVFSCSMYKITLGDKTMVGCNEDAWRITPHIWFENGKNSSDFGAGFTGSRFDGSNGYAPQSGMNEHGLSFSRLASHAPEHRPTRPKGLKTISNPTQYLKDILHTCKTVQEVEAFIRKYDFSYFLEDVFIYIDQTGKYLVVEPFSLTIGDDPSYVLSNFCPSSTKKVDALKLDRYRNGVEFLKNKVDTSLEFCTALSDTMHVCRDKIGDGTLLTSIWDLKSGTIALYFYHQYNEVIRFNLKDELAKGDHIIPLQNLFAKNSEFEKLGKYRIPHNTDFIRLFLIFCGGLFLFSSIYFLFNYFQTRKKSKYAYIQLGLIPFGIIMFYYMYVLSSNLYIFYFSSPYSDPKNSLISLTSYLPILLLIFIFPFLIINRNIFKENSWRSFSKWLLTFNNLIYIILLALFSYWGLFDVFG